MELILYQHGVVGLRAWSRRLTLLPRPPSLCSTIMTHVATSAVSVQTSIDAVDTSLTLIFAQELVDFMIDFLHDDELTLGACALVCKQFIPSSRFHLFNTVLLRPHRAESFSDLLNSAHVTFLHHLHSVKIDEEIQVFVEPDDHHWDDCPSEFWLSVFDKLPPLRTVKTLSLGAIKLDKDCYSSLITAFGNITHLMLLSKRFDSRSDAMELLSGFPSMQTLSLANAVIESSGLQSEASNTKTANIDYIYPTLTTLHLQMPSHGDNWSKPERSLVYMLMLACPSSLQTLSITVFYEEHLDALSDMLQRIGDGLVNLSLRLSLRLTGIFQLPAPQFLGQSLVFCRIWSTSRPFGAENAPYTTSCPPM